MLDDTYWVAHHLSGRSAMSESPPNLDKLKIFADGAALAPMLELAKSPHRRLHDQPDADAQGRDQRLPRVRRDVLAEIRDKPISFEVFADDAPR